MITAVLLGAVLVASLVLVVVELRIQRIPEAQRTDRQRRFLAADRRYAERQNRFHRTVTPWLAVGAGLLLTLVSLTLPGGHLGARDLATAIGGIALAVGSAAFFFWQRGRQRDDARRRRQEEVGRADRHGRARFFGNAGAALAFGLVLGAAGAGGVAYGLVVARFSMAVESGFLVAFGALLLVLALVQRHDERTR